jgi:outer membrane protein TolC
MRSRDLLRRFVFRFVGSGVCAVLLMGISAFAQNNAPPDNSQKQPGPRQARFLQPQAADQAVQEKQPGKGVVPGKEGMQGKGQVPDKEFDPLAKPLPMPALEPGEEGLVINLPVALRLANVRAWDITIAVQQLQIAVAQRLGADVLWLPTLLAGTDYLYHSGPSQQVDGTIVNTSRDSLYTGGAPLAIFAVTDAIFTPLAARQVVRAQAANIQTSRNDTLTDLAQTYFDLWEAQADLASIMDVDRRAAEMVKKAEALAPGIMPPVELARTRAAKANFEQFVETARQKWRDSSAELARIARLKPTVVLQPLEPAHLRVTLVPPTLDPNELIPVALATRPELTFFEAQAEAARQRERQEKWRPFLPTVIARGGGSTPPYPMAFGTFAGAPGDGLGNFAQRSDWDVSVVWTLQNLGLGNLALIRERRREFDLARSREYRFQDVVAREVVVAWADMRSADRRLAQVERELKQAELSARLNLESMGEVVRLGQILIQVIRPLEVVASLQALNVAYFNYYGVIADYNRAQFRMYRALGSPAQMLEGHDGLRGPLLSKNGQK